ncbi:MAG: hypothetical protein OXE96_02380 [Gemmatimonadetes bacterium]|nr:hypothetical protein [Gemmatimonadota bacterium]
MTRSILTGILAAASLTACASGPSGPPPFDPVGSYSYTADVDGQVVPGSMTVEVAEAGYTGLIHSDMFPPIPINSVTVLDQMVTIEASGPSGPLLIEFVAVEGVLQGTWAMGEQGGTITASKSN